jgi:hypothetical protein
MTQIVIDGANAQKLSVSAERAELLDATGRLLGYFVPCLPVDRNEVEQACTRWTEAELNRRANLPGGKSTAEILEKLSQL